MTRTRPGIAPWRTLTPDERAAAYDAYDDLLDAACDARREGWRPTERDPLAAAARRLGVVIWPALADRISRDAVGLVASP